MPSSFRPSLKTKMGKQNKTILKELTRPNLTLEPSIRIPRRRKNSLKLLLSQILTQSVVLRNQNEKSRIFAPLTNQSLALLKAQVKIPQILLIPNPQSEIALRLLITFSTELIVIKV